MLVVMGFYFFVPIPWITNSQKLSIQEVAFNYLYDSEGYGSKEKRGVFYIDIGKGGIFESYYDMDIGRRTMESAEPSGELLSRLSEWPTQVKAFSMYRPVDPNSVVVHNEKGEPGVILSVGQIIKSLGLSRCRTHYYGNGLCAAEYETFLVWTPFGWKHFFSWRLWVS